MTNERNSSIINRLHLNNYHIYFIFQSKITADKYKINKKVFSFLQDVLIKRYCF